MGKIKTLGQDLTARLDKLYQIEKQQQQQGVYKQIIPNEPDNPNKREAYAVPLSTLVNL